MQPHQRRLVRLLGNYAGEDPGFDAGQVYVPNPTDTGENENPYAAVLNNPALRSAKKKNKGKVPKPRNLPKPKKFAKEHIEQEWEIKVWGNIFIFGATMMMLMSLVFSIQMMVAGLYFILIGTGVVFALSLFQLFAGIGMRSLKNYGRIMGTIWLVPGIAGMGIGTIISIMLMVAMWNKKGSMIFSERYKKVIAMTPHVQYSSIMTYILVGIFIFLPLVVFFVMLLIGGIGFLFALEDLDALLLLP